jgi:hypothetical protein
MKIPDRCNTLWVIQSRKKVRKGAKKPPWRVGNGTACYARKHCRRLAKLYAEIKSNYEHRCRRYTDTGRG